MNKRLMGFTLLTSMLLVQTCVGYTKFCFTTYRYPHSDKSKFASFHEAMHELVPFGADASDYTFTHPQGFARCFVKLKPRDRKKVQESLALYDPSLPVKADLVAHFAKGKKKIVAWVLEDFRKQDKQVTIGDIISAMHK